ncbi:hypothetical protein [uncultured Pseudokineococcus sp.]|uniref:hypothetical protein n=1 Tax=uncultured Pseudokineococcus sp. TaxID=1642928 RepID=UPI00263019F2|nr:hypothetical protein [uncultured Pseudokineococcus sp.]
MTKLEKVSGLSPAELDAVVARHSIHPATLRAANFEAYFAHRTTALVAVIEAAMDKRVFRETDPSHGAEAPAAFENADDKTEAAADADDVA